MMDPPAAAQPKEQDTSSLEQNQNETTKEQSKGKDPAETDSDMKESKPEGVALPPNLAKAIRRRSSSVIGSTSSNGGSGNNSDNSGLVSIGNNSFGFNFDSEEGMNSNSASDGKPNESDSGEDTSAPGTKMNTDSAHGSESSEEALKPKAAARVSSVSSQGDASKGSTQSTSSRDWKSSVSSLTESSTSDSTKKTNTTSHEEAAAAVVASLHSIASQHSSSDNSNEADKKPSAKKTPDQPSMTNKSLPPFANTRKRPADDQDTGGYNSEADGEHAVSCPTATRSSTRAATSKAVATRSSKRSVPTPTSKTNVESTTTDAATVVQRGGRSKKAKKALDDTKREERNAREKERSYRISKQINELRNLLSSGGVIVPKGTKSSVLTEAANYIRMLQQHQYRSEIDRHQLVQQMQMIGGGALGPQASNAVRHVAAQNGVWSLGNFGGVPPKSAMTYYQGTQEAAAAAPDDATSQGADAPISASVQENDYRFIFNSSPVGMAIASMGGAFIDCNSLFCQLSNYTKQEVCSMTIFNLTSRQDLQHAFDLISQMISPPSEGNAEQKPAPCVLRGSMKNRDDLGLSVGLIRGEDGVAKCFCVTLIKNPTSPFDTSRPTPATANLIGASPKTGISSTPAYTAG